MALCADLAISHSHFLGGPAIWTDVDRDKALAYRRYRAQFCQHCGTRHADHFDEKGHLHDPPLVEPYLSYCRGCEDLGRLVTWATDDKTGRIPAGLHPGIRLFDSERPLIDRPPVTDDDDEDVTVPDEWAP